MFWLFNIQNFHSKFSFGTIILVEQIQKTIYLYFFVDFYYSNYLYFFYAVVDSKNDSLLLLFDNNCMDGNDGVFGWLTNENIFRKSANISRESSSIQ